jgi:hypothetical protein
MVYAKVYEIKPQFINWTLIFSQSFINITLVINTIFMRSLTQHLMSNTYLLANK